MVTPHFYPQPPPTQSSHPGPHLTWPRGPAPPRVACPPSRSRQLSPTPPTAWAARPGSPAFDTGSGWPAHLAALALVASNQRECVDRRHVRARSLPGSSSSPTTANQKRSGRSPPLPQPSRVRLRTVGQEGGAGFWSRSRGVQVLCELGS